MAQSKSISKARGNNDKQKIVEVRIQKRQKRILQRIIKVLRQYKVQQLQNDVKSSKDTKKESSINLTKEDRYVANIKYPDSSAEKTEPVKVEKSSKRNSTQVRC